MRMRLSHGVFLLAFVAQLAPISVAATADQPESPPKIEAGALQLGFLFSFYDDVCGDSAHGDIYRRAIMQRLASCPLPSSEKDAIARQMVTYQTQSKAEIQHYIMNHGKLPDTIQDLGETCGAFLKGHEEEFRRLDAYAAGSIKLDDLLSQGACDPLDGGP